jgi:glutamine---fructose-6-phosphate transaminase (isomerizing)
MTGVEQADARPGAATSAMRATMEGQPAALQRILEDGASAEAAAARIAGRRVLVVGTGTSWHGANQGAAFLRRAGVEAWAVETECVSAGEPFPGRGDALVLLSHRGTKRHTVEVRRRAQEARVPTVAIGGRSNPGVDLGTVEAEASSAFTASHLGALLRMAQLAVALGATLGRLGDVVDAVAGELAAGPTGVEPPARLLELAGVGINAWTAAEGALKLRETAYVATEGLSCEQILHGSAVALGPHDALVCLSAGDERSARLDALAGIVQRHGTRVHHFARPALGELLSVFPLTVVVQRIALEIAEALGTDPDRFGLDLPGRAAAWGAVTL